jgi:hypothetical protein
MKDDPLGWSEEMQAGWAAWMNERAEADPAAFEREPQTRSTRPPAPDPNLRQHEQT